MIITWDKNMSNYEKFDQLLKMYRRAFIDEEEYSQAIQEIVTANKLTRLGEDK